MFTVILKNSIENCSWFCVVWLYLYCWTDLLLRHRLLPLPFPLSNSGGGPAIEGTVKGNFQRSEQGCGKVLDLPLSLLTLLSPPPPSLPYYLLFIFLTNISSPPIFLLSPSSMISSPFFASPSSSSALQFHPLSFFVSFISSFIISRISFLPLSFLISHIPLLPFCRRYYLLPQLLLLLLLLHPTSSLPSSLLPTLLYHHLSIPQLLSSISSISPSLQNHYFPPGSKFSQVTPRSEEWRNITVVTTYFLP